METPADGTYVRLWAEGGYFGGLGPKRCRANCRAGQYPRSGSGAADLTDQAPTHQNS